MIRAVFEGGPYDGQELGIAGGVPSYLMLMDNPTDANYPAPLVVGAGFDDHWPGQQRYDLTDERLAEVGGVFMPTVVYTFTAP